MPPAESLQGRRRAKLATLFTAGLGSEFEAGRFTLIRTSKIDDFACHLGVWPAAPAPRTGGRQLPQLAIEVASTASLAYSGRKGAKLAAHGVRRVLAIDVERSCAPEWSAQLGAWTELDRWATSKTTSKIRCSRYRCRSPKCSTAEGPTTRSPAP